MVKNEEREIDGIRFFVTGFPAFDALFMKGRLGVILAPAAAEIISKFGAGAFSKGGKALDMTAEDALPVIGPAIGTLMGRLKPEEFATICVDMFKGTQAVITGPDSKPKKVDLTKGGKAAFNEVFSGDLNTMYKAIWMVLQVNDFFGLGGIGKLAEIFDRTKAKQASESEPPRAS